MNIDKLKEDLGDIESAIDAHKNYTDVSIFEVGYYSLASSGVIQKMMLIQSLRNINLNLFLAEIIWFSIFVVSFASLKI